MSKYKNIRVRIDDITLDSKMEAKRYMQLKLLQKEKKIDGLIVHPKFKAIVNGEKVCDILLDFQYYDKETNGIVYEDVKGFWPPISRLKFKLLKALYPEIDVRLLTAK